MKKNELVLRAFVREKLKSNYGIEADETVLRAILAVVTLEEGNAIESEEVRSIKITEDIDGKITAKSTKLYNLMKMSNYDLTKLLIGEYAMIFTAENKLEFMFAAVLLIIEFGPKIHIEFTDRDPKILLTIYELGQQEFFVADIIAAFQARFNQPLTEEKAKQSLSYFQELKVLKYLGEGKYKIREIMVYERN